MTAKRALIVDDSRSARVILSRMLEAYGLGVDTAESAEHALEHLKHHPADVIFMDHLMPGMDGFAAVRAIKSNPQTAMIPVLMYTSQEGDLYMSQARALGAVGVVPKTVKQVDVSRVLYQLHLLPDRRENPPPVVEQRTVEPIGPEPSNFSELPAATPHMDTEGLRALLSQMFKDQQVELRRSVHASSEQIARRLLTDRKGAEPAVTVIPPAADDAPPHTGTKARVWNSPWLIAAVIALFAIVPAVLLGSAYLRTLSVNEQLARANVRLTGAIVEQQAQLAAARLASTKEAQSFAAQIAQESSGGPQFQATEPVPYGETPLSGARLERLKTIIERLRTDGFKGVLRVQSYVGDFCLSGGLDGYSLALDEAPIRRCDVVGNPYEDSLSGAQRQSIGFANLLATVNRQAGSGLKIEVGSAGRRPAAPYPDKSDKLTAGEWNRVAARNNRVEFVAEPAG